MRREAKRGRAPRLLPLVLLLSTFLAAPAAAQTPPTSYVVEGGTGEMAMGPDGTLWFTAAIGRRVGRIKPDGSFEIVGEIPYGYGTDLTVDAAGNLWLPSSWEAPAQGLMRLTPGAEATRFPLPQELGEPSAVAAAPGRVWFASWKQTQRAPEGRRSGPAYVGWVAADGAVKSFPLPGRAGARNSPPRGIALDPQGNLWVPDYALARIDRVSPAGQVASFKLRRAPYALTAGPGGDMWFIADRVIGRISPTGKVTEFRLLRRGGNGIVAGPDGNIWFGDDTRVGRVTPWGQVSSFHVGGVGVSDLVAGRDGSIWFGTTSNPIKYFPDGFIGKLATGEPGVEIASTKAVVRDGRFALSLECGGSPTRGCAGEVRFGWGKKEIALGTYAIPPESRDTVRLRLPAPAQRRLARQRFWHERFRVTVEGGQGAGRGVLLRLPSAARERRGGGFRPSG